MANSSATLRHLTELLPLAPGEIDPSFIASNTVVYAPSVPETNAPFISSRTTVYAATVTLTDDVSVTTPGTYQWTCPPGITKIYVECIGGGGGGDTGPFAIDSAGGGGGGAYAARKSVSVTPGTVYTFVVGAGGTGGPLGGTGGTGGTDGSDSTFTGDGGVQVIAKGGKHAGAINTGGAGGTAAASTGDAGLVFDGGSGSFGTSGDGGGGGASGNRLANGANATGQTAGVGADGGGSGGTGGGSGFDNAVAGHAPGGGGGGGSVSSESGKAGAGGAVTVTLEVVAPFITSRTTLYAPQMPIQAPFIGSHTVVYTPDLPIQIDVPFIGSTTVVYTPDLPEVHVPFIGSNTHVFGAWVLFDPNKTYRGPGNGGEIFTIRLNANGVTDTATLAADITSVATHLELTGDGSLPSSDPFVAAIDDEVVYLVQLAPGSYRIRGRGVSNTTPAAHTAGATVSWGDSYDMAIRAGANINASFTADILSTGVINYPGWLVCFDSTQAYLSGDRYAMHVTEVLGVFDAGSGSGGTNRCDGAQPNAICVPAAIADDCPAALSNPARISTDIAMGDVALVRYTNPEATVLDLASRSASLQSWFGLKRVDSSDADVTFTDPDGYVVDTIPSGAGPGPFTGSVEEAFAEPLPLQTGIAPDASDLAGVPIDTPNQVPWMTITMPGTDRHFTYGSAGGGYDEQGWPMACIAVRNGNRRVPLWQSWDWRDYSYVYSGFATDDTFAQILINRNGIVFDSVPSVDLPGPQDIDGPDVVWDDATYYFAAVWYVVIFSSPYLVYGPTIGGTPSGGGVGGGGFAPGVTFPGGSGGGGSVTTPPTVEGGSGGDINGPPAPQLFQAASV